MSKEFEHFSEKKPRITPQHVEYALPHLAISKMIIKITLKSYFIPTIKKSEILGTK